MLVAVALLVGFYALALAVAFGALGLVALQWATDLPQNVWLSLACILLGVGILRSIVPRRIPFAEPGPEIARADQPELTALIDDVAHRIGQQPPDRIYLDPGVQASATQEGGLLGFGGRRHVVVGLPLLDVLTVEQLRAVVAHELGHFHSGDTRLGPWFMRTYDALERTVVSLHELESIWRKPFTWYFDFFLRRSSSIRRRREFVADEMSARVAGRDTTVETLSKIARCAPAYDGFWDSEAAPVLEAGYRIPILEGFRQYRAAPRIREALDAVVAAESERGADPYDTHPSIAERIAALRTVAEAAERDPDVRPALGLLRNPDGCEDALLRFLAGDERIGSLETLPWARVPERVLVPRWRRMISEVRQDFSNVTVAALPDVIPNIEALVKRAVSDARLPGRAEDRRALGLMLLATGYALALHDAGWSLAAPIGEPVVFESSGHRVEPFDEVWKLAEGELSATDWRTRVGERGVSDLRLGASAEPEAATESAAGF